MPQAVSQIIMIKKGRLSRAKMIAWSRRQRICAEGESNRVQPLQTLAVRRPQLWLGNRGGAGQVPLKKAPFNVSMDLWQGACETEASSRSAWLGACGRFDLNPKIASMVQNLQRQGAEQAHQPDGTVHMVLQCEVRSSQELLL